MLNPLENYLTQFRFHLKGIPTEQRDAEVEETRQHILALIQHRMESGDSEEVATDAALRQFGTPHHNGKNLRKMLDRGDHADKRDGFLSLVHFLCVAVLLFSLMTNITGWPWRRIGDWHGKPLYEGNLLGYLSSLPNTFFAWTVNPPFVWASCVFVGGLAAMSLLLPRQLRTLFLGVFATLVGSALTVELFIQPPHYVNAPHEYISYIWKTALFFLSSSAFFLSLWRDRSLFTSTKGREVA